MRHPHRGSLTAAPPSPGSADAPPGAAACPAHVGNFPVSADQICREEPGDEGGDLGGTFEREQVAAAVDDLQSRVWDDPGQDAPVDRGNDRVVIASEYQGGLRELPQPGQTGPEADRVELVDIAVRGRGLGEPRDRATVPVPALTPSPAVGAGPPHGRPRWFRKGVALYSHPQCVLGPRSQVAPIIGWRDPVTPSTYGHDGAEFGSEHPVPRVGALCGGTNRRRRPDADVRPPCRPLEHGAGRRSRTASGNACPAPAINWSSLPGMRRFGRAPARGPQRSARTAREPARARRRNITSFPRRG